MSDYADFDDPTDPGDVLQVVREGPAPVPPSCRDDDPGAFGEVATDYPSYELRASLDQFAAAALTGLLAQAGERQYEPAEAAGRAWGMALAMLAQRPRAGA